MGEDQSGEGGHRTEVWPQDGHTSWSAAAERQIKRTDQLMLSIEQERWMDWAEIHFHIDSASVLIDGRTGGSRRRGISPSSSNLTRQLLSSPPPAPGSACAQWHLPPRPQRGGGGLYPGRGGTAGSPPLTRAVSKNKDDNSIYASCSFHAKHILQFCSLRDKDK